MEAWEALEMSRAWSNEKLQEIERLIEAAAMSPSFTTQISVPSNLWFTPGLTTYFQAKGYKVSFGDQREPGCWISWAKAKKP